MKTLKHLDILKEEYDAIKDEPLYFISPQRRQRLNAIGISADDGYTIAALETKILELEKDSDLFTSDNFPNLQKLIDDD